MSDAYTDDFIHDLTYWPPGENTGFGKVSLGDPVALTGRWQDRQDLFRDAEGREVVSEAVVYVSMLLENGGWLYLGTSMEIEPPAAAREVRAVQSSPDLEDEDTLYKAML